MEKESYKGWLFKYVKAQHGLIVTPGDIIIQPVGVTNEEREEFVKKLRQFVREYNERYHFKDNQKVIDKNRLYKQ